MDTLIPRLKAEVEKFKKQDISDSAILNHLKEYLQIIVLNYIYNSKEYSDLVMYGGSVLRIGYELPRMSEDLDFQTSKNINLDKLSENVKNYFKDTFSFDIEISERNNPQGTSTLTLKFPVIEKLDLPDIPYKKLNLKMDINFFEGAKSFGTEKLSIVKDDFSFLISTYPLSTLMASKIVAVLQRGERNINGEESKCKPRDVYDLLWYLEKGTIPSLEYVNAKIGKDKYRNILELFDDVNFRVSNLADNAFENDLASFFYHPIEFQSWFRNWRERFLSLLSNYSLMEVDDLIKIRKFVEPFSDNVTYAFIFSTKEDKKVAFSFTLSDYWFEFKDIQIDKGHRVKEIEDKTEEGTEFNDLDFEYIGLLYKKIMKYLKENNNVVTKELFKSKAIRTTARNLDIEKQIVLNKRTLEKVELGDMLM